MKLNYLNSARGLAILMVILVHVSTLYTGMMKHSPFKIIFYYGQMGVQLFFIASAYTLFLSSDNRKSEKKWILNFYIRRYFRIFPIYYLGIIIYSILNNLPGRVWDYDYTIGNILANIFLIHGLIPSAIGIVPGGWSIGTEILFYLIFPFVYKLLSSSYLLLKSLILIIICYLVIFSIDSNVMNNSFWYYNIIVQLPVFITGIVYYKLKYCVKLKIAVILFLIFTLVTLYLWQNHFIVYIPLTAAISFCGLINILEKMRINSFILQKIGLVSYSIYIIHWIIPFYTLPKTNNLMIFFIYFIITIGASYLIALLLEKNIETPFVKLGQKIIRKINKKYIS